MDTFEKFMWTVVLVLIGATWYYTHWIVALVITLLSLYFGIGYYRREPAEFKRQAIPQWVKDEVLKVQNNKCSRCQKQTPYLEFHHIKPIEMGGTNDIFNIVAVCPDCHSEFTRGRKY